MSDLALCAAPYRRRAEKVLGCESPLHTFRRAFQASALCAIDERKRSRASIRVSGVTSSGFRSLRSRLGIAKFLTLLASILSNEDGSDMALNPRRINSAMPIPETMAITRSERRSDFQILIAYPVPKTSGHFTLLANDCCKQEVI
jgi:hypothetical protein